MLKEFYWRNYDQNGIV